MEWIPLTQKGHSLLSGLLFWWWGQDLNLQPSGYEPDELPIAPPHDVGLRLFEVLTMYDFAANLQALFSLFCIFL